MTEKKAETKKKKKMMKKEKVLKISMAVATCYGVGLRCRLRIRMLRATRTSRPMNWYELFLSVLFKSLSKCFCDCTVMGS